jgi:hypothetical protein
VLLELRCKAGRTSRAIARALEAANENTSSRMRQRRVARSARKFLVLRELCRTPSAMKAWSHDVVPIADIPAFWTKPGAR